jgi:hypothetical protein
MPTTPQGETITDYYLMMLEDFEFEIPCESINLKHRENYPDAHAADWVVLFSCGHTSNWCNPRLTQYVFEEFGVGMYCAVCDPMNSNLKRITVVSKVPISST